MQHLRNAALFRPGDAPLERVYRLGHEASFEESRIRPAAGSFWDVQMILRSTAVTRLRDGELRDANREYFSRSLK
jgi:hypothetical protein